jgi:hypothetical protein
MLTRKALTDKTTSISAFINPKTSTEGMDQKSCQMICEPERILKVAGTPVRNT